LDPSLTKIKPRDLGEHGHPDDECSPNVVEFEKVWKEDLRARGEDRINMYWVVVKFCGFGKILQVALCCCAYEVLMYLGPTFAIAWTLNYISYVHDEGQNLTAHDMLYPAGMIVLLFTGMPVMMALMNTLMFMISLRMNIKMVGAMCGVVYKKAMRLPACSTEWDLMDDTTRKEYEEGRSDMGNKPPTYNLLALTNNDVAGNLTGLQVNLARLIIMIPIIGVLMTYLCNRMGNAAFAAVATVLLGTLVVLIVTRRTIIRMRWCQGLAGYRLHFLQEMLFAIRLIKAYGWEECVSQRLVDLRDREVGNMWWYYFWSGITQLISLALPRVLILASFVTYINCYGVMAAADIFAMIQVLNAFKGAAQLFMGLLPSLVAIGPSIMRLDKFLKLDEAEIPEGKNVVDNGWVSIWPKVSTPNEPKLLQVQGTFAWLKDAKPVLRDIDVTIEEGQLVAICGEVGSGKTTLVNAMLGELCPVGDARLSMPDKVAYSAQVPLICEGTLKDNVLFWQAYDESRYKEAIWAASLRSDLEILPGGDEVPVGSRGISLSGGQRSRVSVARAAYSNDTELAILDDPFAAVDGPTGQHILDKLVCGPIMKGKTRVIVCQPDLNRIKNFDKVIVMKYGRIVAQGTPAEIVRLREYRDLLNKHQEVAEEEVTAEPTSSSADSAPVNHSRKSEVVSLRDEEEEGRAEWHQINYFVELGRWKYVYGLFFFLLLMTLTGLASDITLARWVNNITYDGNRPASVYLWGFAFWAMTSMSMFVGFYLYGMTFTLRISSTLFKTLLDSLMNAPIDRFYDKTPVGRIMNRLSTELGSMDYGFFGCIAGILGTFMAFCVPLGYVHYVMPLYFSICCIPFYFLLFQVIKRYWYTMVPLRYCTTTTRSGVNVFVTEVDGSRPTVRAYGIAPPLCSNFMLAVDDMMKASAALGCIRRWTLNRLLIMYAFFTTLIALVGLLMPRSVDVGSISLCLANVILIIMSVEGYVDQATQAQFQGIAMNRLHEYTGIVQEKAQVKETDSRLKSWTVMVNRQAMGRLECQRGEGWIQIVRLTGEDSSVTRMCQTSEQSSRAPHQVILKMGEDYMSYRPAEGFSWGELDPGCEQLQEAADNHLLISVNLAYKDVVKMAEDLCYGRSEEVMLQVRSGWLQGGAKVEFKDFVCGYGDCRVDVLKGLNASIPPKAKCGFIGQTGCGKSTTILALLRIIEPRKGAIVINDVDTTTIGLTTLRKAVGLVPQEPCLFTGTLRYNLDPFEEYPDEFLWHVLGQVQLVDWVLKGGAGLQYNIRSDGDNMSFGQKQLLCIARMLLRQPSLLLLDEATSAIDPKTQNVVQKSIMTGFPESTLIAIAHRLETILDFDLVIGMEAGLIVEKGHPKALSEDENSMFGSMLRKKKRNKTAMLSASVLQDK